ncbi:alpha/beta hydrolase [Microbacterium esteraromaticum]|uniref:Alpha/beta hydrolase n=1 Tax=Microbacterium esteraromaticum TaxID=57043 RepID=A0A939IU42_9MICO|nr:alpha/beta fold hydrolase [Microbacterium esteraromaticum]MBN8204639.1 alpha/beta hydrolase [Microbacterium esteraromaticum]MBN8414793.1 alpha/beta hydrolase [Microbacterium esteraromaticum]
MTHLTSAPPLLLVPGHWLGAWAWDEVARLLEAQGVPTTALTLPGLDETDPDRADRTLDDQAAAIARVVAAQSEPVVIVAHSGANAPVTLVLDRMSDRVARVVWVDSGPVAAGSAFAPDYPEGEVALALPPFEVLAQQASVEGLEAAALERFRSRAVAQPVPVLRQAVELTDAARFAVPTTLVCCSIPSAQVIELVAAGHPMFAELGNYTDVDYRDLPTGHWPMWSRPGDLAEVLAEVSR